MNELSINTPNDELEQQILQETNLDNLKNIINLFNLNIKKKDILRTAKLNTLQDKVYDQMDKRLTSKADEFSNSDLLNYFKVIQDTINKSDNTLDKVDTPSIQIIQNQLNVTANSQEEILSKESRQKVTEIVQKYLELSNKEIIDSTYEEMPVYEQLSLSFDDDNTKNRE